MNVLVFLSILGRKVEALTDLWKSFYNVLVFYSVVDNIARAIKLVKSVYLNFYRSTAYIFYPYKIFTYFPQLVYFEN